MENIESGLKGNRNSDKDVVIVTGGSGLIGSALINELQNDYRVIGLDTPGHPYPPLMAENVSVDISSEDSIKGCLERIRYGYGNKIASVVHLAAYYDFSGKPSPLYEKITVKGTEMFLNALQSFNVRQFIFSSSLLVYDSTVPGKKISENSPLNPKWDYPRSKVKTEKILFQKRGAIPVVNLRIAGVYDDEGHSIPVSNQVQRIYEKQITSHFYPGDLSHGNVFIHLEDLVNAMVISINKKSELPEEVTLNLGEPETLSYGELQIIISHLIYGKEWKTYKIPKALAKFGAWVQDLFGDPFIKPWMIDLADDHFEFDITLAKKLLGWKPKHSLRETLPKMIASLKANPDAWYKKNKLKK